MNGACTVSHPVFRIRLRVESADTLLIPASEPVSPCTDLNIQGVSITDTEVLFMRRRAAPEDLQLALYSFAGNGTPLCNGEPALNGYRRLCYHCPRSRRSDDGLFCTLYGFRITVREKYALKAWKALREEILARDGNRCTICGVATDLHIHHIDCDRTNDDPANLTTLCERCHSRIHRQGVSLSVRTNDGTSPLLKK